MELKTFRTGGLCVRLLSDEPIRDADFFPLFLANDGGSPDLTVRVLRAPLPAAAGKEIFSTNHRRRVLSGGLTYDYTYFPDARRLVHVPYACAVRGGDTVTLYVDYDAPFWDTMIFDAVGLPDFFLEHSAAVVHAAFIGVGEEGILFAGPKQAGKTTQARLWQACADAVVINDDRAVIREYAGRFLACGVPFCGSSRTCLNEQKSVRAIVFPEKSEENAAVPLSAAQSFRRLIGCLSYTETDPVAQARAVRFAERLATECCCFRLLCRPDADAVRTLGEELEMI